MPTGVQATRTTRNHDRQRPAGHPDKLIRDLKASVVAEGRRLLGGKRLDPRAAARACGIDLALNLDHYWNLSQGHPSGPVKVIDMFSGCGGMSTGFQAVNGLLPVFDLVHAVDIDQVANRSYERNLALKPAASDVAEIAQRRTAFAKLEQIAEPRTGQPFILIGCAPCQGFSSHRNSAGETDQRNSLFLDFARIAARLGPDAVVVENVPELLTHKYWPFVVQARAILQEAGYHVYVGVHNMAAFGVPQERFRALLLAMRHPFRGPAGFLDRGRFRTVRDAIGDLPRINAGERYAEDDMHYTAGHNKSTLATIRAVPKDGGSRPADVGPPCLRRVAERQGKAAYEDVYGRLSWDKPAITITAYSRNPASGRFVHPEQDRGLSVREAALLQGFPKTYWFHGSLDERFRQVGNAVPPTFAAHLAMHILGELLDASLPEAEADQGVTHPLGHSFSRMIPSLKARDWRSCSSGDSVCGQEKFVVGAAYLP